MLNVGSIGSAGGMAGYLTSSESQFGDSELQGAQWDGEGAAALGLEGEASKESIEAILSGQLPNGETIGQTELDQKGAEENKRKGVEYIFSAPKSVSILAVTGGDKRIVDAFLRAEKATMQYVEKQAAQTRIKENKITRVEKTSNLVYARTTHAYDDAGKPHLHSHVAIANMTQSKDGKWRALDNSELYAKSALFSAVNNRILADEMRKLGYDIRVHPNGRGWDIVDVPKPVIDANASRSAEIKAKLEINGKDGYAANKIARYETRENIGKDVDPKLLDARNLAADAKSGFDARETVAAAQQRSAAPTTAAGQIHQTITQTYRNVIDHLDTHKEVKLKDSPFLPTRIKSITQSAPQARAYVALAYALHKNEQREAAFLERAVLRDALELQYQGVTIEALDSILAEHKSNNLIVEGTNKNYITTQASLARERNIISHIDTAKGQAQPHYKPEDVKAALEPYLSVTDSGERLELNKGQLKAAELLLSHKDGIVLIQGYSGTGKTSTIGPVARLLEANAQANGQAAKTVFGLAPSRQAVEELANVGLASTTITAFLNENQKALAGDTAAIAASQQKYAGGLFVIDEASMIGNHDLEQLTALYHVLNIDKMALVGDKRQLQAVDQGKGFDIVQTLPVARAEITDVVRQRDPNLRLYNEYIRHGNVEKAFEQIRNNVIESPNDYVADATRHYLELTAQAQKETLVITAGNVDRQRANQLIQSGLRELGQLEGEGITHTIYENKGLTDAELTQANRYEANNILRVAKYAPSIGLKRGDYQVLHTEKNKVQLRDNAGHTFAIDPRGYQGKTHNEAITLLEPRDITLHVGDQIRWTANENQLGLTNGKQATVASIGDDGIGFTLHNGTDVALAPDAAQIHSFDLAYAVNAHKVQGATSKTSIWAAQSDHRFLTTLRQAYVNGTRSTHQMTVYTDNAAKLEEWIGKSNSDKFSALQTTGELEKMQNESFAQNFAVGAGDTSLDHDQETLTELKFDDEDFAHAIAETHDDEALKTPVQYVAEDPQLRDHEQTNQLEASLTLAVITPQLIDLAQEIKLSDFDHLDLPETLPTPAPAAEPERPAKPEVIIEKTRDFDIS